MKNKIDMTNGNIYKLILLFSLPLFIGNLFQLLYTLCDSVIASHLIGSDALAAIGATSSVTSLIVTLTSGMGAGASIIISKAFGEHNNAKIKNSIFTIIVINILISIVISLVVFLLTDGILNLLNVPLDIYQMAKDYFVVMILGLITTLMYNTLSGILRAFGNSFFPLLVLIFSSIINIGGDFLFILPLKMGLFGSALATIIAQLISVIVLIFYLVIKYPEYRLNKSDIYLRKNNIINILTTGLSMGLMNSIFTIGGILMSRSINELGSDIISANTSSRRVIEIGMMPISSLSNACSIFVSQNYGAKKVDRAKDGVKKTIIFSFIWSIIFLLIIPLEKMLIVFLAATNEPIIIDNAMLCINWSVPFYFPLGVLSIIRASLQSFGKKIVPLISSSIELVLKLISAFLWIPNIGYVGACITEPISWVVCCIFITTIYIIYFKTKKIE